MAAPLHRCLVVWCAWVVPATAIAGWLTLVASAPAEGFADTLVRLCAVVGAAAAAWLAVVGTAVVAEALVGRGWRTPGVPAPVRRALLVACGAAVAAGLAVPAEARTARHDPPQTAARVVAAALAGLPLPDRPHGQDRPPSARPAAPPAPPETVTVRPGDTLWSLAADHLGDGARWPELYAANRAVIGADPDLIRPAERLRIPTHPKETR